MPKKGGKRSKTRTHASGPPVGATMLGQEAEIKDDIPRSIVAKASKVGPHVGELVRDIRKLMGPYTANNLREKSYNRMKDFAAVAGQLGVTHLIVVSQTNKNVVLRVARFPNGPTLHFRIAKYSLSRQVRLLQKRPFESPAAYMTPPLVVLNNFSQSEESQVKLMRVTFQHMFPTINVKTVKLSECRRVVLFNFNKEDGTVEMRHYAIRATPVGISRSVKKVLQSKIPDLGQLQDIAQFIEGTAGLGGLSDSEAEEENSRVTLPDRFVGKGNGKSQQSAMKLSELGPRLTLEVFKVEQGVNEGDILYHKFVQKSRDEAAATKAKVERARQLKEQRKAVQNENVKRKREEKEQARNAHIEKKRAKLEGGGAAAADGEAEDSGDDDEDPDAAAGGANFSDDEEEGGGEEFSADEEFDGGDEDDNDDTFEMGSDDDDENEE